MNLYRYIPPVVSIYLLLQSGLTNKLLKSRIKNLVVQQPNLAPYQDLLGFVAASWSSTISFFGAMFSAMVSVFSIYGSSKSYGWAVTSFLILLAVFIPMLFYIMRFNVDELAATLVGPKIRIPATTFCRYILLGVNLLLIAAIRVSEYIHP